MARKSEYIPQHAAEPEQGVDLSRRRFLQGVGAVAALGIIASVTTELVGSTGEPSLSPASADVRGEGATEPSRGRMREFMSYREHIESYAPMGDRLTDVKPLGTSILAYAAEKAAKNTNEPATVFRPGAIHVTNPNGKGTIDISDIVRSKPAEMQELHKSFYDLLNIAKTDADLFGYMAHRILEKPFDATLQAPEMYPHDYGSNRPKLAIEMIKSEPSESKVVGKGGVVEAAVSSITVAKPEVALSKLIQRDADPADGFTFSDHIIANFFYDDAILSESHATVLKPAIERAKQEVIAVYDRDARQRKLPMKPADVAYILGNTENVLVDYLQSKLRTKSGEKHFSAGGFFDITSGVIAIMQTRPDAMVSIDGPRDVYRHEAEHALAGVVIRRGAHPSDRHFYKQGMNHGYAGGAIEEMATEYEAEKIERRPVSPPVTPEYIDATDGVYSKRLFDLLVMDLGAMNGTVGSPMIASYAKQLINPELVQRYKMADRTPVWRSPRDIVQTGRLREFQYQKARRELVRAFDAEYGHGFYNRLTMFMDKARDSGMEQETAQIQKLMEAVEQDRLSGATGRIHGQGIKLYGRKPVAASGRDYGETKYPTTNNVIYSFLSATPKITR